MTSLIAIAAIIALTVATLLAGMGILPVATLPAGIGAALTAFGQGLANADAFCNTTQLLAAFSFVILVENYHNVYKGVMWVVRKISGVS